MEVVLAIGAVQAMFFAVLLFNKKGQVIVDKILGGWLIILSIHLIINYLEILGYYSRWPHLIGSTSSLVFLYGPILYIYIDCSINRRPRLKKQYLFHFILFLLYNLALIPFYSKSGVAKLAYSENLWQDGAELLEGILLVIKALFGPIYIVLSLRLLNRHQRNIGELFSDHEDIDLKWLRYIIWSMAVVLMIFLGITIAKINFSVVAMANTEFFIFFAMSVWIFALGFYGIKQTPIFVPSPVIATEPRKEARKKKLGNEGTGESIDKLRLVKLLEEEKSYLQSKLTLQDLAAPLDMPAHQLSQLINREFGQNFFELINHYRVEEVKKKLTDPSFQHLTFLGIALDSGFNSKASFNRIFKKFTGKTPNEYRKLSP